MPDVGDVHAFTERRRGHQNRKRARAEHLLDACALGAVETRVVETDHRSQLADLRAKDARNGDRALARANVHDGFLAGGHQFRQVILAGAHAAPVVNHQVGAGSSVENARLDGQNGCDVARHVSVGGCGKSQHRGAAQTFDGLANGAISLAAAVAVLRDVMCLVNHDETEPIAHSKLVNVVFQELGRSQHHVG